MLFYSDVLAGTLPPALCPDAPAATRDAELGPFARWLTEHRLNINVRQVWTEEERPQSDEARERKRAREGS